MSKDIAKIQVDKQELFKTITDFLETLDENKVAINEITLNLQKENGEKITINCFKDFIKFCEGLTHE